MQFLSSRSRSAFCSAAPSFCSWVHPTATNMAYSPMNDVSVTVNHSVVMVWTENVCLILLNS